MNPSLSRFPAAGDLPSCPALPDPMRSLDGSRIATWQEWVTRRRPELKALFEHYMYGRAPGPPAHWRIRGTVRSRLAGAPVAALAGPCLPAGRADLERGAPAVV